MVTRLERGWAGHFICAENCLFRRNTLLTCGDIRIVISTVGDYRYNGEAQKIGIGKLGRYYETRAFHADCYNERYYDADGSRQISFDSPCNLAELDADDKANDMHEAVVAEITEKLIQGNKF